MQIISSDKPLSPRQPSLGQILYREDAVLSRALLHLSARLLRADAVHARKAVRRGAEIWGKELCGKVGIAVLHIAYAHKLGGRYIRAEQPVRADGGKPALAESAVQSADKRHTVIYAEQLRRAYRIHAVTQRPWRKQLRRTAAKRCRQALRRFAIALGQCAEARLRQRTNKRIGKFIQMSLPPLCRRCKHTVKLPEIVEADPDISGIIRSAAAEYHPAVIRHITLPIYHIARIRAPSRRQSAPYRRTKRRAARITCFRRGYPPQAARSCR